MARIAAAILSLSLAGILRSCFCAAFATTMVRVPEKFVQGDNFAAHNLGFAFADGGGLGLGGSVRRLSRRDRDRPGRRLELQLVANLDSGLPSDAPRHHDLCFILDDCCHDSRLAEPRQLSTYHVAGAFRTE